MIQSIVDASAVFKRHRNVLHRLKGLTIDAAESDNQNVSEQTIKLDFQNCNTQMKSKEKTMEVKKSKRVKSGVLSFPLQQLQRENLN